MHFSSVFFKSPEKMFSRLSDCAAVIDADCPHSVMLQ